jgi:hypothetical protein
MKILRKGRENFWGKSVNRTKDYDFPDSRDLAQWKIKRGSWYQENFWHKLQREKWKAYGATSDYNGVINMGIDPSP